MMTVVCSTKDAENRVIGIFIGHGLQLGQGYVTFGPSMPDNPNVYLSINISLPAAKLDQIRSEVSKIAGATVQA